MPVIIRRGAEGDGPIVGDICYRAFKSIAEAHNFPPDIPNPETAVAFLTRMIASPGAFDVVAVDDGKVVGSNFLDERGQISGVGPITVDPDVQNEGAGRMLMDAVMARSAEFWFAGIRLVQAGYHSRSLALYLKLGFEARELLACIQGPAVGGALPHYTVRAATTDDIAACSALCFAAHGHDRAGELADAVAQGAAKVVERAGRITGYATPIAFFGHAIGETNDDMKALIAAAESFPGPGFLVPAANGELMRWCLGEGLRIVQTMTLMSIGLYNQPSGAWLPSVLY